MCCIVKDMFLEICRVKYRILGCLLNIEIYKIENSTEL